MNELSKNNEQTEANRFRLNGRFRMRATVCVIPIKKKNLIRLFTSCYVNVFQCICYFCVFHFLSIRKMSEYTHFYMFIGMFPNTHIEEHSFWNYCQFKRKIFRTKIARFSFIIALICIHTLQFLVVSIEKLFTV